MGSGTNRAWWLEAASARERRIALASNFVFMTFISYAVWRESGLATAAAVGLILGRMLIEDLAKHLEGGR